MASVYMMVVDDCILAVRAVMQTIVSPLESWRIWWRCERLCLDSGRIR